MKATLVERIRRLIRRQKARGEIRWNAAMLADLGLSRGDLPAITNGSFAKDESRRQR